MLSHEYIQKKLAFAVQTFTSKTHDCPTQADLAAPAKVLITEVAELAMPEFQIVFRPKEMPPQEETVEQEESKEKPEFDLVSHSTKETLSYVNCLAIVGVSMAADIQNLQTQKRDNERNLATLGKHKDTEDLTK